MRSGLRWAQLPDDHIGPIASHGSVFWELRSTHEPDGPEQSSRRRRSDARDARVAGGAVSLEEVTVTGSRIKRTTDFNTPTPTTVIDSATMDSLGLVNIGQALQFSPSNVSDVHAGEHG